MTQGDDPLLTVSGRTAKDVLVGFACLLGGLAYFSAVVLFELRPESTVGRLAVVVPGVALVFFGAVKAIPRKLALP